MMKEKRKYIKSGKYSKKTNKLAEQTTVATPENVESKSDTVKEDIRGIMPENHRELTYEDLPARTRANIDKAIEYRKKHNLPDDTEDRKQRALDYYKWQMEKK